MLIEKIKLFIEEKGISISKFERSIEVSNGTIQKLLKGKEGTIGANKIERIAQVYPELNLNWLLRDEKNMINPFFANSHSTSTTEEPTSNREDSPKPHLESDDKSIIDFEKAVCEKRCDFFSLPEIQDYDFSLTMRGNSMFNPNNSARSIRNGDIVTCKYCRERSYFQWGEIYAFITADGIFIKMFQPAEKKGHIKCISFNTEEGYSPYTIPIKDIQDFAIITGVINIQKWG